MRGVPGDHPPTGARGRAPHPSLPNDRKDDTTMTNLEKYINAFAEALEVPAEEVPALVYGESAAWDSVGHMTLIAALEDAFDIVSLLSGKGNRSAMQLLGEMYRDGTHVAKDDAKAQEWFDKVTGQGANRWDRSSPW